MAFQSAPPRQPDFASVVGVHRLHRRRLTRPTHRQPPSTSGIASGSRLLARTMHPWDHRGGSEAMPDPAGDDVHVATRTSTSVSQTHYCTAGTIRFMYCRISLSHSAFHFT